MIQKPLHSPIKLNKDHPHANGLTACYLMNNYGCKNCNDFSNNNNDILLTNTEWVHDGIRSNNNGEYGILNNSREIVCNSMCGTILFRFVSNSSFADSNQRVLFGKFTGAWTLGTISLLKNSNNIIYFMLVDSIGIHYVALNSISTWQTGTEIAISWDMNNTIYDEKKMAFALNGAYVTPNSSSGATSWIPFTIASDLRILADIDGTRSAKGIIEFLYIYNRSLSSPELKSIGENPYDMFKDNANIFNSVFPRGMQFEINKIFGANAFPIGQGV